MDEIIRPDWPAPSNIAAFVTTRKEGVSRAPFAGFNLGRHVGDDPVAVESNRMRLSALLPGEPLWLDQTHGDVVVCADTDHPVVPSADAAVSRQAGNVCVVMTADCLPVLFCDRSGQVVGAAHAGWKGLLAGVLENTLRAMNVPPRDVMTWFGPAIGPEAFEVGGDVYLAFIEKDPCAQAAFHASPTPGKWRADIFQLARLRLERAGVTEIHGGGISTHADEGRFYSYRRDGVTGRFASLIWRIN